MKSLFIKKRLLTTVLLIPILFSLAGCVYLIVGGLGAVGGYIISPDTVEGITANDEVTIWDAAIEIVAIMGMVQEENQDQGIIIVNVGGVKVTISVVSLNENAVKLTVKARKAFLPKISTAQDVFVKIMSYVNE